MEIMDVYTKERVKKDKIHIRGNDENLLDDDFVLVVEVIIKNDNNELLMTKRSASKSRFPLKWEVTQGSVKQGENTLDAILREMREEIGFEADKKYLKLYKTLYSTDEHVIKDIFIYTGKVEIKDLIFSDGEVTDAKWVAKNKFDEFFLQNMLVPNLDLDINEIYKI